MLGSHYPRSNFGRPSLLAVQQSPSRTSAGRLHDAVQASTLSRTDDDCQEILPRIRVIDHGNAYCCLLVFPGGIIRACSNGLILG